VRGEREERLGGDGNYGVCDETTRRLPLLPQACRRSLALCLPHVGPVETLGGIRWAYVEDALKRIWAKKMREPRNPINILLAPQDLVGLFTDYQSRRKFF
jgi:hypothetical protein